ncbi:MAG TPA: beta-galactosidase [Capsulimonadaceae bacterium]|jgi:hypothetical protein
MSVSIRRFSLALGATVALPLFLASVTPSRADSPQANAVAIGFEDSAAFALLAGPGKNSKATASVAVGQGRTGERAGKVDFAFSGKGYIEFQLVKPIPVAATVDPIDISLWVKGSGHPEFTSVSIRLMDSRNNLFQYPVAGLADQFNGDAWAQFRIKLDPAVFAGTWGPSADKKFVAPVRFFGFAAGRDSDAPSVGSVLIDDITITPTGAMVAAAPPTATISADRDLLVVKPGDSVTFKAALTGRDPGQSVIRYRWRARDFDGKIVSETTPASASAAGQPQPFTFRPTEVGFLAITFDVLDNAAGVAATSSTSMAVLAKPGVNWPSQPPFLIGVNSHLLHHSTADMHRLVELMRLAGFGVVRDGANWNGIEPEEGVWKWERMDDVVETLRRANIQLAYGLAFTAKWATTGNPNTRDWHDWNNAPPVTAKFVEFAKTVVNHYKTSVHYWEIWNEPDLTSWLGTSDQYAALLSAAVKAVHEADPKAQVMNGGISEVNFRPGFTEEFLTKASTKPDIFAYHTHGALLNMPIARTKVAGYLGKSGISATPVWLNEAGISSFGGVSVREQAITLAKKIATSESLGDRAYIWYDMIDDGTNPNDAEHHFGVVYNDLSPKPAFVVAHTVIDRLCGKSFASRLAVDADQTAYCFRGAGESVATLWSDRQGTTNSVLLRSSASSATLTDLMGRTRTLKAVRGYYTVPVSYEPCYFTVAGDRTAIETVKPVLSAPSATIAAGSAASYDISVNNPLTTRLTGTLTLKSDTLRVEPGEANVDIAPGKTQTVRVVLTAASNTVPSHLLRLNLASTDSLPPVEHETRLRTAEVVPALPAGVDPGARTPFITLDPGSRHLVSPYLATPMESLKFHGPSDLAAKVWLYSVPEGIRLHIAVTDDVHAPDAPGSLWKGDSVQIAMVGPSEKLVEWTTALTANGPRIERSIWPAEFPVAVGEQAQITRAGTTTTYDITLPRTIPEIAQAIRYGCRMSVLVNDNDGAGRKGWLEWTPGIGASKDPTLYAPVVF